MRVEPNVPSPEASAPVETTVRTGTGVLRWFRQLTLVRQFALVGSLVTLAGMGVTGKWVAEAIQMGVVRNSAISSAVYMESFIAPLSQELVEKTEFKPETIAHMREVLSNPPLSERIVSVKIWREGGEDRLCLGRGADRQGVPARG